MKRRDSTSVQGSRSGVKWLASSWGRRKRKHAWATGACRCSGVRVNVPMGLLRDPEKESITPVGDGDEVTDKYPVDTCYA